MDEVSLGSKVDSLSDEKENGNDGDREGECCWTWERDGGKRTRRTPSAAERHADTCLIRTGKVNRVT